MRHYYGELGADLAYAVGSGSPADGLAFRKSLLEKYPSARTAPFLRETADEALRAGRPEVQTAALASLLADFPDAQETVLAHGTAAQRAMREGDGAAAESLLKDLLKSGAKDRLSQKMRTWAAGELRRRDPLFVTDFTEGPGAGREAPAAGPVPDPAVSTPPD